MLLQFLVQFFNKIFEFFRRIPISRAIALLLWTEAALKGLLRPLMFFLQKKVSRLNTLKRIGGDFKCLSAIFLKK
jgi:hypothetical protein